LDFKSKHIILCITNFIYWDFNITIDTDLKNLTQIFILFILFPTNGWSQEPSYFILGEEELSGIDIYDLYQDSQNNYWVASNNGIYKYDGYEFKQIFCSEMTSNSVFNLRENEQHHIFCNNLSGQIFKVENDSCSIYFTIPDSLMNPYISYEFDNLNKLTILTNYIFQVSSIDKSINYISPNKINAYGDVIKTRDKSILFYNDISSSLMELKDDTLKASYILIQDTTHTPMFLYYQNNLISYDRSSGQFIPELSAKNLTTFPSLSYQTSRVRLNSDDKNIWITQLTGGTFLYANSERSSLLYPSKIISAYLIDNENNTLFGTFGNGIMVVPNVNVTDLKFEGESSKITKIAKTNNGQVLLGNQLGEITKIDANGQAKIINEKGKQRVEILEYLPNTNEVIVNSKNATFIDLNTHKQKELKSSSVKDLCYLDSNSFLLATNQRLNVLRQTKDGYFLKGLESFNLRNYCVGYDSNTKIIYCGTALGLKIGSIDSAHFKTLNNQPIIAQDIKFINDKILVATKNKGVLVFNNDNITDNWTTKSKLPSNNIKQIIEYENEIFLSSNMGITVLDLNGKYKCDINKSNG
jgi:hypothetical protein